jgi:hypothetical protein
MFLRYVVVPALTVAALALAACSGDSSAGSSSTALPSATAATSTAEPTGWECFNVGIYDTSLCRLPSDRLVLSGVGADIFSTGEKSYSNCPESWTANDEGRLCVPPSGWEVDMRNGAATLSSSTGVQVMIGSAPFNVLPEKCDPVYVFGIVLGGTETDAQWCINLGGRYAHLSVPAGLLSSDYYEAFQVALSAGS